MRVIDQLRCSLLFPALLGGLVFSGACLADEPAAPPQGAVYAVVNGKEISVKELDTVYSEAMRKKFYHGAVPEGQADAVRQEAAELLIERVLLQQEVARLEIKPDMASVDKQLADYDRRYKDAPRWQQQREQLLPGLRAGLEARSQLELLDKRMREAPPATLEEIRAYYQANQPLFTEPEQMKLSVILLKVDPSAPKSGWDKAREEAQAIYQRLKSGADFAETARLHSGDATAANGGDMGYVHRGMLPDKINEILDGLVQNVVSEPVTMLEGVALVRLDGRREPKLRDFEDVKTRAGELLARARSDNARKEAVARLRNAAIIEIKTPIAATTAK